MSFLIALLVPLEVKARPPLASTFLDLIRAIRGNQAAHHFLMHAKPATRLKEALKERALTLEGRVRDGYPGVRVGDDYLGPSATPRFRDYSALDAYDEGWRWVAGLEDWEAISLAERLRFYSRQKKAMDADANWRNKLPRFSDSMVGVELTKVDMPTRFLDTFPIKYLELGSLETRLMMEGARVGRTRGSLFKVSHADWTGELELWLAARKMVRTGKFEAGKFELSIDSEVAAFGEYGSLRRAIERGTERLIQAERYPRRLWREEEARANGLTLIDVLRKHRDLIPHWETLHRVFPYWRQVPEGVVLSRPTPKQIPGATVYQRTEKIAWIGRSSLELKPESEVFLEVILTEEGGMFLGLRSNAAFGRTSGASLGAADAANLFKAIDDDLRMFTRMDGKTPFRTRLGVKKGEPAPVWFEVSGKKGNWFADPHFQTAEGPRNRFTSEEDQFFLYLELLDRAIRQRHGIEF